MKVAIPLDEKQTVYHNNPFTAPKFAIYNIDIDRFDVHFTLNNIVESPWGSSSYKKFKENIINCTCNKKTQDNIRHICEHYSLLEVIADCNYLLADHYCINTSRVLNKGGIKVFKIPSIINRTDLAIKNFLIGASFANRIQDIYNVS